MRLGSSSVRSRVALAIAAAVCLGAGWVIQQAPVQAAPAPGYQEYVALGDSSAASAGILPVPTSEFVPVGCAQQTYNYPHQIATALGVPSFFDATCSGATTAHMTGSQIVLGGANQPQFNHLTPTTDLVTLSIGANDISMGTTVPLCFSLLPIGSSPTCKPTVDQTRARMAATEQAIAGVIQGIRQRSPNAQIFVVNYLSYFTDAGCWPVVPITPTDSARLTTLWNDMNSMVANATNATGAHLVDAYRASLGHDFCTGPNVRWVEGLIPISVNGLGLVVPFHPNSAGCGGQAAAALSVIQGVAPLVAATTSSTSSTTTTPVATTELPPTTVAPTSEPATTVAATAPAETAPPETTAAPVTTETPATTEPAPATTEVPPATAVA